MQDYDETYPTRDMVAMGASQNAPLHPRGWADAIYPYTKNVQIFQCPSEPTPGSTNPNAGLDHSSKTGFCDYFYNIRLGDTNPTASGQQPASLAILSSSALTVMNGDSVAAGAANGTLGCGYGIAACSAPGLAVIPDTATRSSAAAPRLAKHNEGHNFAFADGHVKWYKAVGPATFSTPSSDVRVYQFRSAAIYNVDTPMSSYPNSPTFAIQ